MVGLGGFAAHTADDLADEAPSGEASSGQASSGDTLGITPRAAA